ncbi:MAG: hypothetical protein ACTSPY_10980 [Candidatus Helarchaeota archaeon]
MKNNKVLFLSIFSILAISFIIPVFAQQNYLLGENDVPGWYLYTNGSSSASFQSSSMSMVWQIWINNNSWINSTKAVCLMVMEFPQDISETIWMALKLLFNNSAKVVPIPGLTDAYVWSEGNLYAGIGYNGRVFLIAIGYNQTVGPGDPFGTFWRSKAPTESSTTESDIVNILYAQGSQFSAQIPGFEIGYILLSVSIIAIVILIFKRPKFNKYI